MRSPEYLNRVQKLLEDANIKLASVVSDVLGVLARALLGAILVGEKDSRIMAEIARGQLRNKIPELEEALEGKVKPIHRFLLAQQLAHIDYMDEAIKECSAEIEKRMGPFIEAVERLDTIPGVNRGVAQVIVAEIGTDMGRIPSPRHLASWAGMCPGSNESAGKRKSGKTRKGCKWPSEALAEAAWGAARNRRTLTLHRILSLGSTTWQEKSLNRHWSCHLGDCLPYAFPTSELLGLRRKLFRRTSSSCY